MHVDVRLEQPSDLASIRDVNCLAFGQPLEADIVDALREAGALTLSLVAAVDARVVGHILFSPVTLGEVEGVGLAPMAVLPEFQRQGVGSALIREGLARLHRVGCPFVVVLGHPDYYPKFGFTSARSRGITCEWDVPDEAFMMLVFDAERMRDATGLARYRPEFSSAAPGEH